VTFPPKDGLDATASDRTRATGDGEPATGIENETRDGGDGNRERDAGRRRRKSRTRRGTAATALVGGSPTKIDA
jgi:hypothetical protein